MDGVGASVKHTIKDTLAYNPNEVIRNTEQLLKYLPKTNISISSYNNMDVENISSQIPSSENLSIISFGFGVSKVHEIFFNTIYDKSIKWKKLSSDTKYTNAQIKIKEVQSQP